MPPPVMSKKKKSKPPNFRPLKNSAVCSPRFESSWMMEIAKKKSQVFLLTLSTWKKYRAVKGELRNTVKSFDLHFLLILQRQQICHSNKRTYFLMKMVFSHFEKMHTRRSYRAKKSLVQRLKNKEIVLIRLSNSENNN